MYEKYQLHSQWLSVYIVFDSWAQFAYNVLVFRNYYFSENSARSQLIKIYFYTHTMYLLLRVIMKLLPCSFEVSVRL